MVLAALLLPLGVWRLSARQQNELQNVGLAQCRAILKPWQFSPSVKAGHPAPVATLSWLHAFVTGVVPNLSDREAIRQQIDQLNGLQCGEDGVAALRVLPHLEAKRDGTRLVLSGELPESGALEQSVQLMKRAEPGLNLDSSGVMIHPAVLPVDLPQRVQDAGNDPLLAAAWKEVQVAWPVVQFDFTGRVPKISGAFPDARLRDAVLAALREARPDLKADETGVAVEPSLPPVDFKDPAGTDWHPPAWLKDAWEKWTVYPALKLRVLPEGVKVDGIIANAAILNNVLIMLHRMRPDLDFTKGNISVRNGSLDKPLLLPAVLAGWVPPPWLQPLFDQVSTIPPQK